MLSWPAVVSADGIASILRASLWEPEQTEGSRDVSLGSTVDLGTTERTAAQNPRLIGKTLDVRRLAQPVRFDHCTTV